MNTRWITILQLLRFSIVGLSSNLTLYALYLVLTRIGMGHKSAMTLLFALGVLQTFAFNGRWTFDYQGGNQSTLLKYTLSYTLAYSLNLISLLVLVDNLGYPHQAVQAVMIFSLALILFLLQKFWVFRAPATARTQA
jgi:putative flippase GtrA